MTRLIPFTISLDYGYSLLALGLESRAQQLCPEPCTHWVLNKSQLTLQGALWVCRKRKGIQLGIRRVTLSPRSLFTNGKPKTVINLQMSLVSCSFVICP